MSDKPLLLTQRAFIDRSRVSRVTVRGVEWITDAYVMVRADALRTVPKDGKDACLVPVAAARRVIDGTRDGVRLSDSHTMILTDAGDNKARFLGARGRFVAINPTIADEWLSQKWDAITQADSPQVAFWQKRRGKLTLIGCVMPMHIGFGMFRAASIASVDAVAS